MERDLYNTVIKKSREEFVKSKMKKSHRGSQKLNSYEGTVHVSFDFAQQIHIPSNPQQPGPLYFLVPFKVAVFGIANDTDQSQANYLIPEPINVSKGANAIISYLDNFFENYTYGEKHIHLHADNCIGQNKNNYVISYFCWRIMNGLNKSIKYSFLPTGHTKFSCDWSFGLIKKVLRHTPVSTIDDLVQVVSKSTLPSKINYSVLTGNERGDVFVPVKDWTRFFNTKLMKSLPQITKYSHFYFDVSWKGMVKCQVNIDDPDKDTVTHTLFPTSTFKKNDRIQDIIPEGLTEERKMYLYEKIRPFCDENKQDLLCPAPLTALLNDPDTKRKRKSNKKT